MKNTIHLKRIIAGCLILAAIPLAIISCTKTGTPAQPTSDTAGLDLGAPKIALDTFIKVNDPVGALTFHICGTTTDITTDASYGGILYYCGSPALCSGSQISIKDPSNFCFNQGTIYTMRATTGPATRKTLKFKYPVGYDECTVATAVKFEYDAATGNWSVSTPLNGVAWNQGIAACP